jgi:hypothetical protein
LPSANVVEMIDKAAGEMSAAPKPWSARKPMSIPDDVARPFSSEAVVKTTRPRRKSRFLPSRSPARPPSRRKPAKTRVYALMIHCRFVFEKCRAVLMCGIATFTIVASRTTMNCARQMMTRTTQGFVE